MTLADAIQTHMFWVQCAMFFLQAAGLVGLGLYVCYTRGLLKSSRDQVEVSQGLIKAAMDQVEGLSKPCLTLLADLRDPKESIMELGGAVGGTVVKDVDGNFVAQNIGNGVALNVGYSFEPIDPPHGKGMKGNKGYLQHIVANQRIQMPLPVTMATGQWEASFEFDSLGGRRYRTAITLKGRVFTDFKFNEIGRGPINSTSVQ